MLLAAAILAAGCRPRQAAAPEPVRVLATCYALADLAKQIGGDRVTVDWVLEDGQDTNVEMSDDLRRRLMAADLVVAGGNCDAWAVGGFEDPNREQRMVRIDMLPNAPPQAAAGYPWLDPDMAKELCRDLATRLAIKMPAYESAFRANADSYCKQIDDAVQRHSATLVRLPRPRVIAMNDQLAALARRFGIDLTAVFDEAPRMIGPPELHAINLAAQAHDTANSQTSDLPLDAFHQMYSAAAAGGAQPVAPPRAAACALLVDVSFPQEVLNQLSNQVNLPVLRMDAMGSSSSATGGKQSYLDLLNYDMDQLGHAVAPQGAPILPTIIVTPKNTAPATPTFKDLSQ
jgi:ABC-type Zn uptake system ZnuABC Zn-binding protein ZnuA